ncbi:hypothetical protein ACOMICROBIO_FLGHMIGD_00779 [Vibrio sp. B1FLJ16]|nr:hypothetical protein ACOMICROBIO_FLGHMIGD_00779 [Vibrio sp. B1FLJ16]CAE6889699.1 hypothetical protein ACOMICROBIO_FLGHMIGD_00779 [Vibrio sp. B1FLJ16]
MNTFTAYRVQLYIENDWQVRDERAAHSVIKSLATSLYSYPRLNNVNTDQVNYCNSDIAEFGNCFA